MTPDRLAALQQAVADSVGRELKVAHMKDEELRKGIEDLVRQKAAGEYITPTQRLDIVDHIFSSYRGLGGLLDEILKDEEITEVMINGSQNIFVEKKGRLQRLDRHFQDEKELRDVIDRIAKIAKREVTEAEPILDARLKDGSRVNVVLNGISLDGSTVTIRKFTKDPMTMQMLMDFGSITPEVNDFLHKLVQARYNIFIAGGTGSGKTTFLNALSNYIPKDERIITIEDSAELQIKEVPNIVRLETRNKTASSDESTEITIRDLIRSSLRMRPDRIIVGEVRGAEALDMLQAMNTGHDGSLSTGHANSAEDMISRLETMVLQGAANLPLKAVRQQIVSAVDIIIHLSRLRDHSRKTMTISEVLPGLDAEGNVRLNTLYKFYEDDTSTVKKVSGKLTRTHHPMTQVDKLLRAGYTLNDIPAPNPAAKQLEEKSGHPLVLKEVLPDE
ncbi:CpaF family protein [uncultured Gemmiger sp.]|uniref:CpaF family protein n=1 Tax=uncultured Gemmiger sp. TaxID=1623490 RepID=UPI0025CF6C71|nr:CpaF family protein [uncultured Gemmiger sp.]